MPRWIRCCLLAVPWLASGCASPPPPASPRASSADLDAWLDAAEPGGPVRSITLAHVAEPAPGGRSPWMRGPITLSAPPQRPQRRPPIDVAFQKADMQSAFQLLADAGRFNLVMQEGLTGQVSATLRRIDPFDALAAMAAANGVEVRYDGQVVVLKKR
jgi:hypothetical protein